LYEKLFKPNPSRSNVKEERKWKQRKCIILRQNERKFRSIDFKDHVPGKAKEIDATKLYLTQGGSLQSKVGWSWRVHPFRERGYCAGRVGGVNQKKKA